MAKAVSAVTPEPLSVQAAAAQIIHLINARPQTPWPHEIESIIARVEGEHVIFGCAKCAREALRGRQSWGGHDEALAVDREVWLKLVAAQDAAIKIYGSMRATNPAEPAARAAQDRADQALWDFYENVWSRPARGIADIAFLAEITYREHWHEQGELRDPRSDEVMECEPEYGGPADEALVALLKAIRDIIGPTKALSGDDAALVKTVRGAIARHFNANMAFVEDDDAVALERGPKWREVHASHEALEEAEALIPRPPRSPLHLMLLAEVGFQYCDVGPDGVTLKAISEETYDPDARLGAKLVEGVLSWFGGIAALGGMQPAADDQS